MRRTDPLDGLAVSRQTATERQLYELNRSRSRQDVPATKVMAFAFGNKTTTPTVSESADYPIEADGCIVGIVAKLKTAGTSTTTVQVYHEDSALVGSVSLTSGNRNAETRVTDFWVAALEGVEVRCTSVGTEAKGLSVAVLWVPGVLI